MIGGFAVYLSDQTWIPRIKKALRGYDVEEIDAGRAVVICHESKLDDIRERLKMHSVDYMAIRWISGWVIYRYE